MRVTRLLPAVLVAALAACSGSGGDSPTTLSTLTAPSATFAQVGIDEVRGDVTTVVAAANRLGVATAFGPGATGTNPVVAPWATTTALAMLRRGATGETAAELDKILGTPQSRAYAALLGQLAAWDTDLRDVDEKNPPNPPVYHQATGVFVQAGTDRVQPDYLTELRTVFDSGVYPVDFAGGGADTAINRWITENTNGKITEAPGAQADTLLSLLATSYLAAAWETPFRAGSDGPFTRVDGSRVTAKLMGATLRARTARGRGWQALELPFADGLAMRVVLPDAPGPTPARPQTVTADTLAAAGAALKTAAPQPVEMVLPRFSATTPLDLRPVLDSLGAGAMFTDRAELDGIGENLLVQKASQQTRIDVTEKGVTAAAVVKIDVGPTSVPPSATRFAADRPFAYQIVDTRVGLPLFFGAVTDPTAG